jgi:heat shock protein HtpX
MVAFIFALVINFVSYWFSDRIILSMYRAKEVQRHEALDLFRVVEDLAAEAGMPAPRVYMMQSKVPNAFATGRDPAHAAVCVTDGILELLAQDELKGVLAHELSHIKNRDTLIMTVTASIAGAIMMLADMARWAAIFGGSGRGSRDRENGAATLLVMAILAPIAALIVQLAISRSREYAADARGASLAHSPYGLANALKKLDYAAKQYRLPASPQTAHLFIVNPLRGDMLMSLFSTHPPIEKRIERLESMTLA